MSATVRPVLGNWYQDLETQQIFKVVAADEAAETVEIQYLGGDIAGFDLESWYGSEFELAAPPEDWSAPFDEMEADDSGYTDPGYHSLKKREIGLSDLLKIIDSESDDCGIIRSEPTRPDNGLSDPNPPPPVGRSHTPDRY
jgi:Family of unknown function (DUF6763)